MAWYLVKHMNNFTVSGTSEYRRAIESDLRACVRATNNCSQAAV